MIHVVKSSFPFGMDRWFIDRRDEIQNESGKRRSQLPDRPVLHVRNLSDIIKPYKLYVMRCGAYSTCIGSRHGRSAAAVRNIGTWSISTGAVPSTATEVGELSASGKPSHVLCGTSEHDQSTDSQRGRTATEVVSFPVQGTL